MSHREFSVVSASLEEASGELSTLSFPSDVPPPIIEVVLPSCIDESEPWTMLMLRILLLARWNTYCRQVRLQPPDTSSAEDRIVAAENLRAKGLGHLDVFALGRSPLPQIYFQGHLIGGGETVLRHLNATSRHVFFRIHSAYIRWRRSGATFDLSPDYSFSPSVPCGTDTIKISSEKEIAVQETVTENAKTTEGIRPAWPKLSIRSTTGTKIVPLNVVVHEILVKFCFVKVRTVELTALEDREQGKLRRVFLLNELLEHLVEAFGATPDDALLIVAVLRDFAMLHRVSKSVQQGSKFLRKLRRKLSTVPFDQQAPLTSLIMGIAEEEGWYRFSTHDADCMTLNALLSHPFSPGTEPAPAVNVLRRLYEECFRLIRSTARRGEDGSPAFVVARLPFSQAWTDLRLAVTELQGIFSAHYRYNCSTHIQSPYHNLWCGDYYLKHERQQQGKPERHTAHSDFSLVISRMGILHLDVPMDAPIGPPASDSHCDCQRFSSREELDTFYHIFFANLYNLTTYIALIQVGCPTPNKASLFMQKVRIVLGTHTLRLSDIRDGVLGLSDKRQVTQRNLQRQGVRYYSDAPDPRIAFVIADLAAVPQWPEGLPTFLTSDRFEEALRSASISFLKDSKNLSIVVAESFFISGLLVMPEALSSLFLARKDAEGRWTTESNPGLNIPCDEIVLVRLHVLFSDQLKQFIELWGNGAEEGGPAPWLLIKGIKSALNSYGAGDEVCIALVELLTGVITLAENSKCRVQISWVSDSFEGPESFRLHGTGVFPYTEQSHESKQVRAMV